jgi:hypothetical protein
MLGGHTLNQAQLQDRLKRFRSDKRMVGKKRSTRVMLPGDLAKHYLRLTASVDKYKTALLWGVDKSVMYDVGLMKDRDDRWGFVMADTGTDGLCRGPWSIKYLDSQTPKSRTYVKKFGLGVGVLRGHAGYRVKRHEPLIITAGMKDLLSVRMLGYQTVGLDGEGHMPHEVVCLAKYMKGPVIFFLDADEPGQVATKKHYDRLMAAGVETGNVKHHPQWAAFGKDVTDYRVNGLHDTEIRKAIYGAVEDIVAKKH